MKIVIIGAMKEEITFLLSQLDQYTTTEINHFTFYQGKIYNNDLVVVESGIGKVMSGILMATLVNHFNDINKVINVGVAGGFGNLSIGDVVVGTKYIYGDVDVTGAGNYCYGQMARCPRYFIADSDLLKLCENLEVEKGTICTNDRFVADFNELDMLIKKHFHDLEIKCFDMESTAFAQSCFFYKLDFLAIRAISDVIGSQNPDDSFEKNLHKACLSSNLLLIKLLQKI